MKIVIPRGKPPRAIYSKQSAHIMATLGNLETRRASRVETWNSLSAEAKQYLVDKDWVQMVNGTPYQGGPCIGITRENWINRWWADLLAVEGPVLGPYTARNDAITAELEWLDNHNVPHPA